MVHDDAESRGLGRLKAEWVESMRPLIALIPEGTCDELRQQMLETMVRGGWTRKEAKAVIEELLP
jgi:hypothetical protein